MSWLDKRQEFQARLDKLQQVNVQKDVIELDKATRDFIAKGGVSENPNASPTYTRMIQLSDKLSQVKKGYLELQNDIQQYIQTHATDADMAGLMAQNGELLKQIKELEKIQEEQKVDVESAIARDELLRSSQTDVNRHELFLLDRPIRKGFIPYLWVLSVLFIGIGLLVFRSIPGLSAGVQSATPGAFAILLTFLEDRRVWISLFGASLIVILFLSLKVAGVFGK